ncbi:hypothetical protein L6164_032004 [Bauhinia variegata]|uniref:Uncharacterized protein n=1 Tax=Bauhinia variegata TaxID=167791 RepID=A0ACB9KM85_BAUVA|nr:hypothetical protein L6164_032004 [Bauhinia variegata]
MLSSMAVQKPKERFSISPLQVNRGRPLKKVTEKLFRKKTQYFKRADSDRQSDTMTPTFGLLCIDRRKRAAAGSVCDTSEAQSSVLERGKEVQANLAPEFPSFIKCMLPSHVTGGFWLGLPSNFCQLHLPKTDTIIVLEDESGKEYETKYLCGKVGLSGGWRGFSLAHNLVKGDVLVFHLVQRSKFKVYIIRSNGSDELGGALGLLKLDACKKEKEFYVPQENDPKGNQMICGARVSQSDQPENTSEDFGSEVFDGIKLSESAISFQEVTSIENFSIHVDGLVIDSELNKYLKTKYYELCSSQRSFLHDHLLEGLNCKLAAGIISETINIADAIRASKITTSPDSFAIWDQTLKAFETMGMNVSFLRARLNQLLSLALKSKRYKEIRLERDHAEEEKKTLEAKLVEVKMTIDRIDAEIETQNMKSEKLEVMFQKLVNAPWRIETCTQAA